MKKKDDLVKHSLPYVILFMVILMAVFFYGRANSVIHVLKTGELFSP